MLLETLSRLGVWPLSQQFDSTWRTNGLSALCCILPQHAVHASSEYSTSLLIESSHNNIVKEGIIGVGCRDLVHDGTGVY